MDSSSPAANSFLGLLLYLIRFQASQLNYCPGKRLRFHRFAQQIRCDFTNSLFFAFLCRCIEAVTIALLRIKGADVDADLDWIRDGRRKDGGGNGAEVKVNAEPFP